MKISPPIAVLAIAAIGIAVTVWLVPAQPELEPQGKVSLSTTKKNEIPAWIWRDSYLGKDRQFLTTAQILNELFDKAPIEGESPANQMGPRVK